MVVQRNANYWRHRLNLTQHVEGGSFREIYRSELLLPKQVLTPQHQADRNALTSIYFLLEYGEFSAFHRIASDELWHHYDGGDLCIYEISAEGKLHRHLLGVGEGSEPFVFIKAGSWFGSRVETERSYTLCGCSVAPGFDFQDFDLADRTALQSLYPQHSALIAALTH